MHGGEPRAAPPFVFTILYDPRALFDHMRLNPGPRVCILNFVHADTMALVDRTRGRSAWRAASCSLASGTRGSRAGFQRAPVDRGDIVDVVGATGTLQAVTTVQVGSQVSGTIDSLGADFNSRGQEGPGHRPPRPLALRGARRPGQGQPRRRRAPTSSARGPPSTTRSRSTSAPRSSPPSSSLPAERPRDAPRPPTTAPSPSSRPTRRR